MQEAGTKCNEELLPQKRKRKKSEGVKGQDVSRTRGAGSYWVLVHEFSVSWPMGL